MNVLDRKEAEFVVKTDLADEVRVEWALFCADVIAFCEEKEMLAEEREDLGIPDPFDEQLKRTRTKSGDGSDEQVVEEVVDEVIEETEEIVS